MRLLFKVHTLDRNSFGNISLVNVKMAVTQLLLQTTRAIADVTARWNKTAVLPKNSTEQALKRFIVFKVWMKKCVLGLFLTHTAKRKGSNSTQTTSSGPNKHDLVVYFLVLKCDHVLCSVDYGIYVEVTNTLWDFVLVLTVGTVGRRRSRIQLFTFLILKLYSHSRVPY